MQGLQGSVYSLGRPAPGPATASLAQCSSKLDAVRWSSCEVAASAVTPVSGADTLPVLPRRDRRPTMPHGGSGSLSRSRSCGPSLLTCAPSGMCAQQAQP
jgi:hypothetical protein